MTLEPGAPLTWGAQLARAERVLAASGSATAWEDATELLTSLLGVPGALLLTQPASHMSRSDAEMYSDWVARRASGEAIPHITGRLLFMGLEFVVERDSPLPVPGARRLVELALQLARRRPSGDLIAAEIGAGCGAVSLALASLEPRFTRIYAVESSATALETASANGARYLLNLVMSWLEGSGLDSVPEPVDVLVCGQLDQRSSSMMSRLLEQAPAMMRPGGALLCVVADEWRDAVSAALARALPQARVWADAPSGAPAIAVAQLPEHAMGAGDSGV